MRKRNRRGSVISVHLTEPERLELRHRAADLDVSISDLVREMLLKAKIVGNYLPDAWVISDGSGAMKLRVVSIDKHGEPQVDYWDEAPASLSEVDCSVVADGTGQFTELRINGVSHKLINYKLFHAK